MVTTRFVDIEPKLFVTGQNFPEGPNFDSQGNLFVCNRWDGFIAKITPDGRSSLFVSTGGKPNGARFHQNGQLFIADIGRREISAANPDGSLEVVVSDYKGRTAAISPEMTGGTNDLTTPGKRL